MRVCDLVLSVSCFIKAGEDFLVFTPHLKAQFSKMMQILNFVSSLYTVLNYPNSSGVICQYVDTKKSSTCIAKMYRE